MSTNFPTSVDSYPTYLGTDDLAVVDHAGMHNNTDAAVVAIETKVGVTGSTDPTSHEYQITDLTRTRQTATVTTSSLAPAAVTTASTFTLAKAFRLLSIQTSRSARVTLYANTAAMTADSARAIGTDPATNAGVILDFVVTAANAAAELILSPQVEGVNMESSPNSTIQMRVTNLDNSTGTVAVTLKWIRTE